MWSLPMFALAMLFIWKLNGLAERIFGIGLFVLVFIPFVLNSPDIVGKEISHWFDYGGIGLALQFFFFISAIYLSVKFYVKK